MRGGVGGVRCGYLRRAAPAAVLAALEDEEPIFGGGVVWFVVEAGLGDWNLGLQVDGLVRSTCWSEAEVGWVFRDRLYIGAQ